MEHVRVAMHERARSSRVVAQLVTELDATWRHMLAACSARAWWSPSCDAVGALIATIQGAFVQPVSSAAGA
jgi:hypothetical protein